MQEIFVYLIWYLASLLNLLVSTVFFPFFFSFLNSCYLDRTSMSRKGSSAALLPANSTSFFRKLFGEGNGNPLWYSCLEDPTDGGAWQATVHGVAKSQTWLSDFTLSLWLRHKAIYHKVLLECWPLILLWKPQVFIHLSICMRVIYTFVGWDICHFYHFFLKVLTVLW